MFSDTLISPKSDQSIRSRYSDMKRRTNSPNFKDILRQRCRERVKARRNHLFDQLRCLQNEDSVRNAILGVIEMDLEDIKSPNTHKARETEISCSEEFDAEPLSQLAANEQEKWILEEYDRMIESMNAQVELEDMVTCPMCAHGVLKVNEERQEIVCSLCSLLLPHTMPLNKIEERIIQAVDGHGQHCREDPQFLICPEDTTSNLLLLCSECGQFYQIV